MPVTTSQIPSLLVPGVRKVKGLYREMDTQWKKIYAIGPSNMEAERTVHVRYLGLPQLGPVPAAIPAGIAALALCYGAYLSEIFRAAMLAVSAGQWEAGESLGLSRGRILRHVVLPQALRISIPPTGAMFISMLKDSSLVSVMGSWEIMFLAQSYGRATYRYVEMLLTAAVLYWVMSICLEFLQAWLERRAAHG